MKINRETNIKRGGGELHTERWGRDTKRDREMASTISRQTDVKKSGGELYTKRWGEETQRETEWWQVQYVSRQTNVERIVNKEKRGRETESYSVVVQTISRSVKSKSAPQQKGQTSQFVQCLGSEKDSERERERERERESEREWKGRGLSDSPLGKYGRQWSITLVVNFYVFKRWSWNRRGRNGAALW